MRNKINQVLVSIVLPVYNGKKFLAESIKSCLSQTYSNLELIIVNDCSTDSSLQIAEDFARRDSRVQIISNKTNLKLPASLNVGHNSAKGEYLTWTSDDNYYEQNAIEVMVNKLSNSKSDIIHANFNIINSEGNARLNNVMCQNISLLLGNNIGCCFLYKKEVLIRNGGYDEDLHTIEDYDFWLQAKIHSKFQYIPDVLYNYRMHSGSLTSQLNANHSQMQISYQKKLEASYSKFFKIYNIDNETYPRLFKNFHLNQSINLYDFLKNYAVFQRDFEPIFKNFDVNLLNEIDIKLRAYIFNNSQNQSLKVLYLLMKNRPKILFGYGRKKSLKIIFKCLNQP